MGYIGSGSLGKSVRLVSNFTANSTLNTTFYPDGGYTKGYVDVYQNGVKLQETSDFTATDGQSVVLVSAASNNDTIQIVSYSPLNLYTHVRRAGDAMTGDLTLPNAYVTGNTSANNATFNTIKVNTNATVNSLLTVTGNVIHSGQYNMTGNIVLNGSLVITGEATSISTESLAVEDTIINLGTGNATDTLDIGFAGKYGNGSSNVYAGIVRDATTKDFYVFQEYANVPNNNINTLDGSFQLATLKANFSGNVSSENILVTQLNAGNINLTSGLTLTGDASGFKQLSTSIWGGDPSTNEGRFEYHSNGWYIAAGPNSDEIVNFQRGSIVKSSIDNDGVYQGTANNANFLGGQPNTFYTNATNISTGTLSVSRLASSGVTANSYGNATHYAVITVDAAGRVTSANTFIGATQGSKGDKGDKGDTGTKGDTGSTGSTGAKGDKGDTGTTGSTGDKGDTGSKGDKGDTGSKGDKGDAGATGSTGDKGQKGDSGSKGDQGDKGDKGEVGSKGDKGEKGERVSTASYTDGNNTITFTNSDTSTFTVTGVKGNKGDNGPSGSPGGANTNIQYNDSGSFAGTDALRFINTSNTLVIGNSSVNVSANSSSIKIGAALVSTIEDVLALSIALG